MDFNRNFEKAFWVLVSVVGMILSYTGLNVANKVDKMSDSVIELNTTMKTVVIRTVKNSNALNDHEKRIYSLEIKQK